MLGLIHVEGRMQSLQVFVDFWHDVNSVADAMQRG